MSKNTETVQSGEYDEWMRQQSLKFDDVALVHLDTALPVNDVESGSVPLLRGFEPISKIFDVRASWQCPQYCALSCEACGDHAHSESNTSEIFLSQHDCGGRSVQPWLMYAGLSPSRKSARRCEEIDHFSVFAEPPFVLRTSRNDHDVAWAADPLFAAEAEFHLALEHPHDLFICEAWFREDTEVIDFFAPPRDEFLLGGKPAYMSEG